MSIMIPATVAIEPPELMVVGDSDQSIYAFRGATIRNINDFESDFPGAEVVMLEQNYRSTQTILAAANSVIVQNEDRKPKNLWSDAGDGEQIVGYVADSEHDEAQFVAGEIRRLRRRGRGALRGRGGLLSHQRAVPDLRGGVHPGRPALQGGRRGPLLRAARGPRRHRLPARDRQSERRRLAAAHPQRAQAGDRRQGRRRGRRAGGQGADQLRGRAAPGGRDSGPGHPISQPAARPSRPSWTSTRRWSPSRCRPMRS